MQGAPPRSSQLAPIEADNANLPGPNTKAGTHLAGDKAVDEWVPAFAGNSDL
jgi:hypothetical protein